MLLASWLSKLLGSSEFGSALFGAVVGGLFVLLAQMLANRAQRKRDRQTEREALIGTLRAIQAELLVLRADCLQPLSRRLKATVPGPFLTMPVQENFFIVYESNAGALGRIGDPKLVAEIVRVYGQAKGLNDALNFNHTRCQVWANLDAAHKGAETQPSDTLAALEKELGHIRAGIDRGLRTLLEDSDRLCADIEAYLDGRKKTR